MTDWPINADLPEDDDDDLLDDEDDEELDILEILGDDNLVSEKIPLTTLYRWYMYDMGVKNPNELGKAFELLPVSPEGHEKEKEDSESRIEQVAPLIAYLNLYASLNAQFVIETQRKDIIKMSGMTEEQFKKEEESLKMIYQNISFAGILTSFSSALELGIINLNGTLTGVE